MSDRIRGVDVDFIDGFNEAARSTYPDEFLCMTRQIDGVITEMILLPGTVYGTLTASSTSGWSRSTTA